jgi:hypothetical protein
MALLNTDIVRAKVEIAKHEREIRMMPVRNADGSQYYMAEGEWNLLGGLDLSGFDFALVAGGCNVLGKSLIFRV